MAQRRRKEQLAKQKQRRSILLCIGGGIGAMLLSLIICIIVFGIPSESEPVSAPVSTLIPYDVTQPFSTSDLTSAQMNQLRTSGRISVSDGPRGVAERRRRADRGYGYRRHLPASGSGGRLCAPPGGAHQAGRAADGCLRRETAAF